MSDDTQTIRNKSTHFGVFELYSELTQGGLHINSRVDLGVHPNGAQRLQCRCGSEIGFDIEVSFCVQQRQTKSQGGMIVVDIETPDIYIRENTTTCCHECKHTGPYQEFVDKAAKKQQMIDELIDKIL